MCVTWDDYLYSGREGRTGVGGEWRVSGEMNEERKEGRQEGRKKGRRQDE